MARPTLESPRFTVLWAVCMSFGTWLHTLLHGELVGADAFGNRYYLDKRTKGQKRERRWVVYKGAPEASKVPAEWHGWLHGTFDELPTDVLPAPRAWEQEPTPNLTGSAGAYRPAGALERGGRRAAATGDYEAWRPGAD